ncbi:MAG TPA: N-acetylmannosamine-6-phosphate 2-epimerase [Candidatus Baltobacteraceae bacterium]
MSDILERLRGGLIVSVQANDDSLLNEPQAIALLARVAVANGAAGVRIEGVERIRAVRAVVTLPIIGIIKQRYDGFEPYITSTIEELHAVVDAGADIVAFDATDRPRFGGAPTSALVQAVHAHERLAMADCATLSDGRLACAARADIVATTLAGYTLATQGRHLPALDLVEALAAEHGFAVCEGGVAHPSQVRDALRAGAAAVVVGTAITNIDTLVRRFAGAADRLEP